MKEYAFGVDIGGTTVKIGLFNSKGDLLDKWEITTRKENEGQQILPDVASFIQAKIAEKKVTLEDVAGIGVGAPGPVDGDGNVELAVNLGWKNLNIPKVLGELIHVPVKAGNDANVAALGEMWQGGGKGHKNLVAVTLGTGVGGGIIINGEILSGATGSAGEIGHLHIEDNEEIKCNCGRAGCLEQYTSATGIARLAKSFLEKDTRDSVLRTGNISAKSVFDAAKNKDAVAIDILDKFGFYLGKGLASVAVVVDPEVFVMGGGVSKAGDILFDFIKPYYEKYAFSPCANVKFTTAMLGNDAGIYGAAGMILK